MIIKSTIAVLTVMFLLAVKADGPYKDGIYTGSSRSYYTDEPYYGYARVTIEKGMIVNVGFFIRDSSKHVLFDPGYERYFAGNNEYVQQCRNDLKGINSYPDSLIKHQDPEKVDVISGATWSYNIFKASVKEALTEATKK